MSAPKFRKPIGRQVAFALLVLFGVAAVWVAVWSGRGNSLETVRLGMDRCFHCGMIVSDLRFAVSALDRDEQGHTVTRHFDDPGCFQEFAKQYPNRQWVGVAHDFRDSREIPLSQTQFQKSELDTPMGSGMVATQAKAH